LDIRQTAKRNASTHPVHAEVDAERVVELVEQAHEAVLAEIRGGKARRGGDGGGGGGVRVEGVDVGQQPADHGWHALAHVLGAEAGEVRDRLVDGLDAVAQRELVHHLLAHRLEVGAPGAVLCTDHLQRSSTLAQTKSTRKQKTYK